MKEVNPVSDRPDFLKSAAVQLGGALIGSEKAVVANNADPGPKDGSRQSESSKFTPPPQTPIEERNFPQYQLSGKPDPETNLLGTGPFSVGWSMGQIFGSGRHYACDAVPT